MNRIFAFGSALLLYFSWSWLTDFIPSGLPHEVILMPTLIANNDLYIEYSQKVSDQVFWFTISAVSFCFSLTLIIVILGMLLIGRSTIMISLIAIFTSSTILFPVLYIVTRSDISGSILSTIIVCILVVWAVLGFTANLKIAYSPYLLYGLVVVALLISPIFWGVPNSPTGGITPTASSNLEVTATASAQEFEIQLTQTSVAQDAANPANNEGPAIQEGTVPENKGLFVLFIEFFRKIFSDPAWQGIEVIFTMVTVLLSRTQNNHQRALS